MNVDRKKFVDPLFRIHCICMIPLKELSDRDERESLLPREPHSDLTTKSDVPGSLPGEEIVPRNVEKYPEGFDDAEGFKDRLRTGRLH